MTPRETPSPVPTWQTAILPTALVALTAALCVLLANFDDADFWGQLLATVGVALVLLQAALSWRSISKALFHRATVYSLNSAFQVALVLAILMMVNFTAWRYSERAPWMPKWDVTSEGLHTFSEQTEKVLARLDKRSDPDTGRPAPVRVLAFFLDPKGATQQERKMVEQRLRVKELLERYARKTDNFRFELVNPEADPLKARQYDIAVNGTIVFETDEQKLEVTAADLFSGNPAMGIPAKFKGEQIFTSKLLDILEGTRRKLYFTTGHREGDLDSDEPDGFSVLRQVLERENYAVAKVNLLVLQEVPEDCSVLIVAGPKVGLAPEEVAALRRYLDRGKPALVMMDSQPLNRPLAELMTSYGVEIRENIVWESDPKRHYPGRNTFLFPYLNGHHITDPLIEDGMMVGMDEVLGLEADPASTSHDIRTILQTSGYSWGETDLAGGKATISQDSQDLENPVSVAFAISSRSGANDAHEKKPEHELRMILLGDSDMVANNLLTSVPGNKDFFVNCVAWLTRDEDRITIRPKELAQRRATIPEDAADRIFWGVSAALPLLVLSLGFAIWWKRRAM